MATQEGQEAARGAAWRESLTVATPVVLVVCLEVGLREAEALVARMAARTGALMAVLRVMASAGAAAAPGRLRMEECVKAEVQLAGAMVAGAVLTAAAKLEVGVKVATAKVLVTPGVEGTAEVEDKAAEARVAVARVAAARAAATMAVQALH